VHGKTRAEVVAKCDHSQTRPMPKSFTATRSPRVAEWMETYLTEVAALSDL